MMGNAAALAFNDRIGLILESISDGMLKPIHVGISTSAQMKLV